MKEEEERGVKERGEQEREERGEESPPSSSAVATPPPSPRQPLCPFMSPLLPEYKFDLSPIGDMIRPTFAEESMERSSSDQGARVGVDTSVDDATRKRRLESPPSSSSVATPSPRPRRSLFPSMSPSLRDYESDPLPVGDMACPAFAEESVERRSSDQEARVDADTFVDDATRKRRRESTPSSSSVATPPPRQRRPLFPFVSPSLRDYESDLLPVGDMACPAFAEESVERKSSDQEARVDADTSVDHTTKKRRLESPPSSFSVATPVPRPRQSSIPFMSPSLPAYEFDILPVGAMACPAFAEENVERRSSDLEARVNADASVDDTARKRSLESPPSSFSVATPPP